MTAATQTGYNGVIDFEVKRWLDRLLREPENFYFTLEDMASKVMCTLAYDDPSLSESLTPTTWGLLTQMSPAGPITNILTPLWDYVPETINPWKLAERKRHDYQNKWWLERLAKARSQFAKDHLRSCWARKYLETAHWNQLTSDFEASCVLGMMATVGIFTVAGPLYYYLIAMVLHPDWQRKCQEEIDAVCSSRMPTLADYPNLPVLRACIKETMRWRPNVPTGEQLDIKKTWLCD